jgi:hypothetical protein
MTFTLRIFQIKIKASGGIKEQTKLGADRIGTVL